MNKPTSQTHVDLCAPKTAPMGAALQSALQSLAPVPIRQPRRELYSFALLSTAIITVAIGLMGLRENVGSLPPTWLASVSLAWVASFAVLAYVGLIPGKARMTPCAKSVGQSLIGTYTLVVSIGLFATPTCTGVAASHPSTFDSLISHAGMCSMVGFIAGISPGTLMLLLMRRFVPVGRIRMGLCLGAAGGSLAGFALLLTCPITEHLHLGLVHGAGIVTSALFVAGSSRILLREPT